MAESTSDALMVFNEDGTRKVRPGEVLASAQKVADAHGHGADQGWWKKVGGTQALLAIVVGTYLMYKFGDFVHWAQAHDVHDLHSLMEAINPHVPPTEAEYKEALEIQTKYGVREYHGPYEFTASPEQVQHDFIEELSRHGSRLTEETIDAVKAAGGYRDEYGIEHKLMVGRHGRPMFMELPNTPAFQHPDYPTVDKAGNWNLHPDHPTTTEPTKATPAKPVAPTTPTPAAETKPATEQPPIPGTRAQESIQGPNDSTAEVEKPKPAPVAEKPAPPVVKHVSEEDYKTAQLNLSQIARPIEGYPEIELNPTPEQINSFKETLGAKLGINPWEVPDDVARDAIMNGGYSDGGKSFELWQNQNSDTIYITERPTDDMKPLGETNKLPLLEISDDTKDQLITGTAVLEDPLTSDFNADVSGYEPGSTEDRAWEVAHKFLVEHEQVYGDSWRETPTRLSEYLALIGVYKS